MWTEISQWSCYCKRFFGLVFLIRHSRRFHRNNKTDVKPALISLQQCNLFCSFFSFIFIASTKQCAFVLAIHLYGKHCARCKFPSSHNRCAQKWSGAWTCKRLSRPIFYIDPTVSNNQPNILINICKYIVRHQCHKSDLHTSFEQIVFEFKLIIQFRFVYILNYQH